MASVSCRKSDKLPVKTIHASRWNQAQIRFAESAMLQVLEGCGDLERSRCFITTGGLLSVQRALTDDEVERTQLDFQSFQAVNPAGKPFKTLWEVGRT